MEQYKSDDSKLKELYMKIKILKDERKKSQNNIIRENENYKLFRWYRYP
jgi:hypothetical protein